MVEEPNKTGDEGSISSFGSENKDYPDAKNESKAEENIDENSEDKDQKPVKKLVSFSESVDNPKEPEGSNKKRFKPLPVQDEKKSLKYYDASESFLKKIGRNFPKEMIPTRVSEYILLSIFLLVLLYGILNFPVGKILAGEPLEISIGYPFEFFSFGNLEVNKSPVNFFNLAIDLLIYSIIAWMLETSYNYASKYALRLKEREKIEPKVFKKLPEVSPKKEVLSSGGQTTSGETAGYASKV